MSLCPSVAGCTSAAKRGAGAIPLEGEGLDVRALARVLQVVGQTVPELPGTNKQLGLNRSASELCGPAG